MWLKTRLKAVRTTSKKIPKRYIFFESGRFWEWRTEKTPVPYQFWTRVAGVVSAQIEIWSWYRMT